MKKFLIFVCWLIGNIAVAQEQVTDFENILLKYPANTTLMDTINGKVLFTVKASDTTSNALWVTDGKIENTHLLKDIFGWTATYFSYKVRKYGYIYIKAEAFWRTDGNTLERLTPNTGEPEKVFELNHRILLCVKHNEVINNTGLSLTSFAWLDSLNRTTVWEEDVISYQIIDSVLHYIKYNKQSQLYELGKLNKNGEVTKNLIAGKISDFVKNFEYAINNGVEYYSLDTGVSKKLIKKPVDSKENVVFEEWGVGSVLPFFPAIVRDVEGHIYLMKHYGSLTIYQLTDDNQLKENWFISAEKILKFYEGLSTYDAKFGNWFINGDKLLYKSTVGGEGIYQYYFNSFDLTNFVNSRSRNLIEYFRFYYYNLSITPIGTDTYILDNLTNQRITYDFKKDSVLQSFNYPFKDYYTDTVFTINSTKIQIAGNIYSVSGNNKVPLLPESKIFDKQSNSFFAHAQLGNQLLFVKYNTPCQCYELWANKGKKDSNTLLLSFKEQFQRLIDVSQSKADYYQGKYYIQTRSNQTSGSVIYETDGTKEGSRKIYSTSGGINSVIDLIQFNERQLVFRFLYHDAQLLIFEDGKEWRLIDIPETRNSYDIYISSDETYVLTKSIAAYKDTYLLYNELLRAEGDNLILVDKDVEQVWIDKDRVYYLRRVTHEDRNPFTLYYTDASGVISNPVKDRMYTFGIYGKKLVYHQVVLEGVFDCTVLDLATQKIDLIVNKISPFITRYVNDVLVINDAQRLYLIKDDKLIDYNLGFNPSFMTVFNNGVLLGNDTHLTYYDIISFQPSVIIKGRNYTMPSFSDNGAYLLISTYTSDNIYRHYYWTLADKKLVDFEEAGDFKAMNPSQIFQSVYPNAYIWNFTGSKFVKKYLFVNGDFNNRKQVGYHFYIPYSTDQRGTEVAKFGLDSLIIYSELAEGKEGIIFNDVFEFMDNIFVYAFTKASGWQVWRMENEPSLILGNEAIPEPGFLKVYPNPTQDMLYINTEKTSSYKLINIKGQLLMQGNLIPQQGIDISQLPQGIYLIQLFDGDKVYVKKVVKQ